MGAESTRRGEDGSAEASLSVARRKPIVSPRERVRSSRIAQGLPAQVEDRLALPNIETMVRWGLPYAGAPDRSGMSCSHTCAP